VISAPGSIRVGPPTRRRRADVRRRHHHRGGHGAGRRDATVTWTTGVAPMARSAPEGHATFTLRCGRGGAGSIHGWSFRPGGQGRQQDRRLSPGPRRRACRSQAPLQVLPLNGHGGPGFAGASGTKSKAPISASGYGPPVASARRRSERRRRTTKWRPTRPAGRPSISRIVRCRSYRNRAQLRAPAGHRGQQPSTRHGLEARTIGLRPPPIARRQAGRAERIFRAGHRPSIAVSPMAIAPNSRARC